MADTSLAANLDELAKRLVAGTDLKAVYAVTGTEADDGSLRPIPPSLDSIPVGILWFQQESTEAGNTESSVDLVDLLIWQRGTGNGYGYSLLLPYLDSVRILLQKKLINESRATRVLYQGASQIYPQTIDNGMTYLVLPIHLEILRLVHTDAYSDT